MSDRFMDRNFAFAGIVMLCTSMVFFLLLTSLAMFAVIRFQANDVLAGLTSTSFILGAVVARLVANPLLHTFGRRPLIVTSMSVSLLCTILYPLLDIIGVLISVRAVHGFAYGVSSTVIVSGILLLTPANRRAQASGYLGIPSTIATAVGPFIAVLMLGLNGYDALFVVCIVFALLASCAALFLKLPSGKIHRSAADQLDQDSAVSSAAAGIGQRPKIARPLTGIGLVILLVGFSYSGVIVYLASYASELDAEWSVGAYFALYSAVALVGRLILGKIQDVRGDNAIVFPVLCVLVLSMLLLAFAQDGVLIAFSGLCMGLGFGMFLPSMQAAAAKVVDDSQIQTAVSTVYVSMDVGVGIAPLILGTVIALTGYSVLYGLLAGVVVCAGCVYAFGHARTRGARPV